MNTKDQESSNNDELDQNQISETKVMELKKLYPILYKTLFLISKLYYCVNV